MLCPKAKEIRKAMEALGLELSGLARQADVHWKTVKKALEGKPIRNSSAAEIARALGQPVDQLFTAQSATLSGLGSGTASSPPGDPSRAPGPDAGAEPIEATVSAATPVSRRNPYDHAAPAKGDRFVGRKEVTSQLFNHLAQGESVCLEGPARIGKTSVLLEVCHRLQEDPVALTSDGSPALPVYFDYGEKRDRSLPEALHPLLHGLLEAAERQCRVRCPEELKKQALKSTQEGQVWEAYNLVLQWACEQDGRREHRPILLLDSLDRAGGTDWLVRLATVLNRALDSDLLRVVLAGRQILDEEFCSEASQFAALLSVVTLESLDKEDTGELVLQAKRFGWTVEDEVRAVAEAHRLTGGHPFALQYGLYNILVKYKKISPGNLEQFYSHPRQIAHLKRMTERT